jgi:alkylhydroperoxidase/carboxymuconolactone decarboxylase family protein YurZ
MSKSITEESFAAGCKMMREVYGKDQPSPQMKLGLSPWTDETVGHLFADIWSRPGLSVRDRRLLVIGATAALGRADLIEIQVNGALENGELNKAELDEMVLQLAFYVGWGNTTAVMQGVGAALRRQASQTPSP